MSDNLPIGGYFGLEASGESAYHTKAICLNTGRNALEYILRAGEYRKLYLPYYSCHVLLEPVEKLKLDYEFYHINEKLQPILDFHTDKQEAILMINYFGLLNNTIEYVVKNNYEKNFIIDNSQAFFSKPLTGIDTFYSPRKFFGVPDGAYLYTDKRIEFPLDIDSSINRFDHLILRLNGLTQTGYNAFIDQEKTLCGQEIKQMSVATRKLLASIDYKKVIQKRKTNFRFLARNLRKINLLKLPLNDAVPLNYPLLVENKELRQYLIGHKVYVPAYWPDIIYRYNSMNDTEKKLMDLLVSVPIDQRYSEEHMTFILKLINSKL